MIPLPSSPPNISPLIVYKCPEDKKKLFVIIEYKKGRNYFSIWELGFH